MAKVTLPSKLHPINNIGKKSEKIERKKEICFGSTLGR
jgi:hypothetical protein